MVVPGGARSKEEGRVLRMVWTTRCGPVSSVQCPVVYSNSKDGSSYIYTGDQSIQEINSGHIISVISVRIVLRVSKPFQFYASLQYLHI